jgi:hypothetical protein
MGVILIVIHEKKKGFNFHIHPVIGLILTLIASVSRIENDGLMGISH